MNHRELWAKWRYDAHFISKPTDCDGENAGTETPLDFAFDCDYITGERQEHLTGLCAEAGEMPGLMLHHPDPFLISTAH